MRPKVSVRLIPFATTNSRIHLFMGCLEDTSLDLFILQYGTNDLNGNSTYEETAEKILNLASSVKTSTIKFSFLV